MMSVCRVCFCWCLFVCDLCVTHSLTPTWACRACHRHLLGSQGPWILSYVREEPTVLSRAPLALSSDWRILYILQYLCLCHGYVRCIPWHIPRILTGGRCPWYMPRDTTQISVALGTNIISVALRPEICRYLQICVVYDPRKLARIFADILGPMPRI